MSSSVLAYRVRFCSVNDPNARYLIVCIDKKWGDKGCQQWDGDWVASVAVPPGTCVVTSPFTPSYILTAVTSSDGSYYYSVEFLDSNGNVVKKCDRVNRDSPCYLNVSELPAQQSCPPLVETGVDMLDKVVFCVGNVGITTLILALLLGFLILLLLRRRRRS
jgi:hypothetical protein